MTRALASLIVLAALAANAFGFGVVGRSALHKTQILKCHYRIDLGSIGADAPSLAEIIASRRVRVGIHFDVEIENPTGIDVRLEDNHLEVLHDGDHVATTRLSPVSVPAGQTVRQRVELELSVSPLELRKGRDLFAGDAWEVTLFVEVAEGFEFPIYILSAGET